MFDNNQNNSPCAFAEKAICYLYGEIDAQEKAVFEAHLKSCQTCAEEFAGLSLVRSSIVDWRNEEFLFLETPAIEIPYKKPLEFFNFANESKAPRSRFAGFRKIFALSPSLSAAAALALILFCAGVVFFAVKSSSSVEIARSDNKNTEKNTEKTLVSPPVEKEILPDEKSISLAGAVEDKNPRTVPKSRVGQKDSIVKIVDEARNHAKNLNTETSASKIKAEDVKDKKQLFARTDKIPRLNNVEEDKDNSLRLAELLGDSDIR